MTSIDQSISLSWNDLALRAARLAGYHEDLITLPPLQPVLSTALTSERGLLLPPLDGALDRFLRDSEVDWTETALHLAAE